MVPQATTPRFTSSRTNFLASPMLSNVVSTTRYEASSRGTSDNRSKGPRTYDLGVAYASGSITRNGRFGRSSECLEAGFRPDRLVDRDSAVLVGSVAMAEDRLIVRGARVHNLRNVTVEIPRNRLTVVTGLSGSGKSSLA